MSKEEFFNKLSQKAEESKIIVRMNDGKEYEVHRVNQNVIDDTNFINVQIHTGKELFLNLDYISYIG
ncbi:MAG: hypothetical protein ACRCZW_15380 [Lactobacillaceae bacterium]